MNGVAGTKTGFVPKSDKADLMRELLRSNDLVLLSFAGHTLNEAGIEHMIFDDNTSAVEGSIGALPRRLMVNDDDIEAARQALRNASVTVSDA